MKNVLYDFDLPSELIAKEPTRVRDQARIFIYNTKNNTISFDYFYNLARYLPEHAVMVLNDTKVVPARITLYKQTGGKVVILFLLNEQHGLTDRVRFLSDRKIHVGDMLQTKDNRSIVQIEGQNAHIFEGKRIISHAQLLQLLAMEGTMPIPLYLRNTPLSRDTLIKEYQTIFAKYEGSVAAPTASLHFTKRVFAQLERKGITKSFVTLHVGMGTFAPVTDEQMNNKTLHHEWYEIPNNSAKMILHAKEDGIPVVAIGTTVVRTLESFARSNSKVGSTDLFIYPPYPFTIVDYLITNFHLPNSSLMMLVEAFLQQKGAKRHLIDLYQVAIENRFRFYSFGDAMVII